MECSFGYCPSSKLQNYKLQRYESRILPQTYPGLKLLNEGAQQTGRSLPFFLSEDGSKIQFSKCGNLDDGQSPKEKFYIFNAPPKTWFKIPIASSDMLRWRSY